MTTAKVAPIASQFPASTAQPSSTFRFPGTTAESTQTVREILTANDRGYDIYESKRFQHNHFPHSALTRYALGGPPKLLEETWKHDKQVLVSLDPEAEDRDKDLGDQRGKVPRDITKGNWDDPQYLGFKGSYSKYLAFFHQEIDLLGPLETLVQYVFDPRANWESENGHPGAEMLARFFAGAFHPLIHTGFGVEFKDRIVLAEGLAEAAIHSSQYTGRLHTPDIVKPLLATSKSSIEDDSPSSQGAWNGVPSRRRTHQGRSLLSIYSEYATSSKTEPVAYDPDMLINDRLEMALGNGHAEAIHELAQQWSLTDGELGDGPGGWESKLEEVAVLATLVACATGRREKEKRVDFFLMHVLTSSILIPALMQGLSIPLRRTLLYCYITTILHTALSRGRPKIDIGLLMSFTPNPAPPGTMQQSGVARDVIADPTDKTTSNVWTSVIESSLYAEDSHVPKSIRSLAHHGQMYGHIAAGGFIGSLD